MLSLRIRTTLTAAVCVLLAGACAAQGDARAVGRRLNVPPEWADLSADFQIVTESWNRVVAVPYLVYMPERNRVLMLVSCDYPHQAMVLWSDDRGTTWSEPKYVHPGADGKGDTGMGTSLTYLGGGRVMLAAGRHWFSSDYGETWGDPCDIPPAPDGKPWNLWDPLWADRDPKTGAVTRLIQTGYTMDHELYSSGKGPGYSTGHIRFSEDGGRTWSAGVRVPEWTGVSEVALARAQNGDLVAACRTDIPARFKGETLDHYEGLSVSVSKDDGATWSVPQRLYDWGRHHPSLVLLPNGDLVMTYVVRKGYTDTADGFRSSASRQSSAGTTAQPGIWTTRSSCTPGPETGRGPTRGGPAARPPPRSCCRTEFCLRPLARGTGAGPTPRGSLSRAMWAWLNGSCGTPR